MTTDQNAPQDFGIHAPNTAQRFIIALAQHVRPRGRVFAIEPVPAAEQTLRQNIALTGLRNITLIEAVCGPKMEYCRGWRWNSDLLSLLGTLGYIETLRTRNNRMFTLQAR